ncbi:MAG: hypothetical protein ACR2M4_00695 [Actinomycetota bacterium]
MPIKPFTIGSEYFVTLDTATGLPTIVYLDSGPGLDIDYFKDELSAVAQFVGDWRRNTEFDGAFDAIKWNTWKDLRKSCREVRCVVFKNEIAFLLVAGTLLPFPITDTLCRLSVHSGKLRMDITWANKTTFIVDGVLQLVDDSTPIRRCL